VTLLDAAPEPGGLATGWRSPQGRACEAGIKGFWYEVRARARWPRAGGSPALRLSKPTEGKRVAIAPPAGPARGPRPGVPERHAAISSQSWLTHGCRLFIQRVCVPQYHNIFALVHELGIPWPFTPWARSGFWSPRGLAIEVRAPAARPHACLPASAPAARRCPAQLAHHVGMHTARRHMTGGRVQAPIFSELPRLPTLLGQFWHTLPLFRCCARHPGAAAAASGR